jgi:cell division protein FtsW
MRKPLDRTLLFILAILILGGFFIFTSASLGLLAREGARFSSVAMSQILFGIVGGGIALSITANVHYRVWRKYAFYIMLMGLALTALVFTPLGMEHGGAKRWVDLGFVTFQPAEFLKYAFIIYIATWLSGMQKHVQTFAKGMLPFFIIIGVVGGIMLMQPDTDTFAIMAATAVAMFITAGGRWRDVFITGAVGLVLFAILVFMRPYLMDRITTFFDPSADPQGKSWQVQQSLIALGGGGFAGRGFGQSIQKFEYLPEPTNDSIFAVLGEEFGFLGTSGLVILFALFALRGYRIAAQSPDLFGMLLVVGITSVITLQAYLNIAAMVALAPLSGLPLPFVSQGGTALLSTLGGVGIILNVSRYRKTAHGKAKA